MKFNRLIDLEWNWTKRKEAALLRKYEREVDAGGLVTHIKMLFEERLPRCTWSNPTK